MRIDLAVVFAAIQAIIGLILLILQLRKEKDLRRLIKKSLMALGILLMVSSFIAVAVEHILGIKPINRRLLMVIGLSGSAIAFISLYLEYNEVPESSVVKRDPDNLFPYYIDGPYYAEADIDIEDPLEELPLDQIKPEDVLTRVPRKKPE